MYLSGQKIATDNERATSLWHSSVIQHMKASTFISESSSPAVSSFLDAAAPLENKGCVASLSSVILWRM